MRFRLGMTFLLVSISIATGQQDRRLVPVEIRVLSAQGKSLRDAQVRRFIDANGKDYAKSFVGLRATVPEGNYRADLIAGIYRPSGNVWVQGETLGIVVTWDTEVDRSRPELSTLALPPVKRGRQAERWARLVSLYRPSIDRISRVTESNLASFYGVDQGDYALLLFDGGTYLGTRIVRKRLAQRSLVDVTSSR